MGVEPMTDILLSRTNWRLYNGTVPVQWTSPFQNYVLIAAMNQNLLVAWKLSLPNGGQKEEDWNERCVKSVRKEMHFYVFLWKMDKALAKALVTSCLFFVKGSFLKEFRANGIIRFRYFFTNVSFCKISLASSLSQQRYTRTANTFPGHSQTPH